MHGSRRWSVGCLLALLSFGCDDGGSAMSPPVEDGPDASVLVFDAAMLWRDGGITLPDYGPPPPEPRDLGQRDAYREPTGRCTGYLGCSSIYSAGECFSRNGCDWDGDCEGFAESCYSQFSSYSCNDQEGCYWSYSDETCRGSSRSCILMRERFSCTGQDGCRWDEHCTGVAELCSENPTQGLCELEPGCTWTES